LNLIHFSIKLIFKKKNDINLLLTILYMHTYPTRNSENSLFNTRVTKEQRLVSTIMKSYLNPV